VEEHSNYQDCKKIESDVKGTNSILIGLIAQPVNCYSTTKVGHVRFL